MPLRYSISFFFLALMILVMVQRRKLKHSQIPKCNRAFIFQLSNPRRSLSPLFGEPAPKAKSLSQFTRRLLLFCAYCHDLTIIKIRPLHNHQGREVSCWEKGQSRRCFSACYFYVFAYLFTSCSQFWKIQKEGILNKHRLRVKYSRGALFTKAGEFLSHCRHMFVMWYKKWSSGNSWDLIHRFNAPRGIFL